MRDDDAVEDFFDLPFAFPFPLALERRFNDFLEVRFVVLDLEVFFFPLVVFVLKEQKSEINNNKKMLNFWYGVVKHKFTKKIYVENNKILRAIILRYWKS